ncbi:tetratricopeptide repeat protein [Oscillospiraceae bacterium N12]|uniref:Tetratricopeptide repeat protein n=1 Tax=Jilunia laotingensis TaxID=2763675 RepID=A0A926IPF7_9BACT|nr:tetratricopeptide repeat protein [Jilunia laotingensis]MBC8592470.1 tetratricopeptide repeat protein [Jilunia laotingensis]
MKHLNLTIQSLLFTILLSGVVTSCQFTPKSMDSLLDRVEGCMEAHPDSALQLLESVTEPEKMSEESLARYYLLLTQARDKNYQDLSSDSSIIYSVNYFKDYDDPSRYGKSMYYYGRVMQMCDEDIRAMKIYLEAQNALKEAGEYKMLGLLHGNIAILNQNQSLYTEAIHCSQEAIRYYYEAKDTLNVAYAYQTMGNTFFLMQQMDSVKKCVDRSLSFFDTNPVRLTVSADKLLGLVYSYQKQYEEAERLFLKVLAKEPNDSKKIRHYLSLGHLYQMMGRKQEAEKYLDVCLKDDDLLVRSEAYSCLSDMAVSDSDIKQAFYFKQMADSLFYIVENDRKRDAIAHLQTENVKERFFRKILFKNSI